MTYITSCVECNIFFQTVRHSAKFCSRACSNAFSGKQRLQTSPVAKYCTNCKHLLAAHRFSYIDKTDFTQGRRTVCKSCSQKLTAVIKRNRDWKYKAAQVLLNGSKQRAKRSNIEHTLTLADITIPDTCPVFGIKLQREDRTSWYNAPSIDRIDNTKGYTKDNIIIVSRRANILKKDATIAELVQLAKFYEHLYP